MPAEYVAESLIDAFKGVEIAGKNVLIPCSVKARETLANGLKQAGAIVERIHIYDAVQPDVDEFLKEDVKTADVITFTSSSTVRNFAEIINDIQATIACIGPVTADECRKHGIQPHITANEYTIDGLVNAIVEYYTG